MAGGDDTANGDSWLQRSSDDAVQLFHLGITFIVLIALRSPIATMHLEDEQSRTRTVGGLFNEFGDLESATGVVPIAVIVAISLWVLMVASLVLAIIRPDSREPTVRRVARVAMWAAAALAAFGAVLLVPVLNAADHTEAEQFDKPFLPDIGGVATVLIAAGLAVFVTWRVRSVTG